MSKESIIGSEGNFSFYVPISSVTVEKSENKEGKVEEKRVIQGIASTDDLDLEGEKITQSGLDISYLVKYGKFNDNHQKGIENVIGEVTDCKVTPAGLWVKGIIYKGKERADHWWNHLNILDASGAKQKAGFSIEGKVTRRKNNVIQASWLKAIAVTECPVNPHTYIDLVRSLSGEKICNHPWISDEEGCSCCSDNSCKCSKHEEKAMMASGSPLVPQSLEGDMKVVSKSVPDVISYEEAVIYLQKEKKLSKAVAKVVADSIFSLNGIV